jgi:hypothetical protein
MTTIEQEPIFLLAAVCLECVDEMITEGIPLRVDEPVEMKCVRCNAPTVEGLYVKMEFDTSPLLG